MVRTENWEFSVSQGLGLCTFTAEGLGSPQVQPLSGDLRSHKPQGRSQNILLKRKEREAWKSIPKQIWLSKCAVRLETTSLWYQQSQVFEGIVWHLVDLHVDICE